MPAGDPSDPVATAKAALRRARVASRAAMSDAERERARADLRDVVLDRVIRSGWRCVAGYEPLRTEPGSTALLERLHASGVRVLVPITRPDHDLDWSQWTPAGCGPALGTWAITDADAVLVPAFAVGDDGLRLGRGGGSYDRALPRCAHSTQTAALLFDGEREARVPAEPWDRPVHSVVTPSGWTQLR